MKRNRLRADSTFQTACRRCIFLSGFVLMVNSVRAIEPVSTALKGVEIEEHLGATIPLDAVFTDESGKPVKLGQFFNHDKPVVVALVYFSCPSLCNLVLNGMKDSFKGMSLVPGKDFDAVTISFDPTDTYQLAAAKKKSYVEQIGKPGAAAGWHWLVGEKANIDRVAEAIGFRYQYNEKEKLYAHSAAIYVLSPSGKITRYLYGFSFDKDMRLAVIEASEGKVGTTLDRLILFCCPYDLSTHKYTLVAMRVMRLGGIATLLVLGAVLGPVWWRERRKRRPGLAGPGDGPTPPSAPQLPSHPASGSIPPTSRPTT